MVPGIIDFARETEATQQLYGLDRAETRDFDATACGAAFRGARGPIHSDLPRWRGRRMGCAHGLKANHAKLADQVTSRLLACSVI
jgi:hypothetical protein